MNEKRWYHHHRLVVSQTRKASPLLSEHERALLNRFVTPFYLKLSGLFVIADIVSALLCCRKQTDRDRTNRNP